MLITIILYLYFLLHLTEGKAMFFSDVCMFILASIIQLTNAVALR